MEEWRDVVGTNGKYQVSNTGKVRNAETKHIRKSQDKHGYRRVNLTIDGKSKNCAVHRLVASAFIPNPENKSQVNHKDGVHDNNNVENLEWVTAEENFKHAVENNLYQKGIERYKRLGHSTYNRKDKPKAYLRKSEIITKKSYDKLMALSEKYGLSISKFINVVDNALSDNKYRLNHTKNKLIFTEEYMKFIRSPYAMRIESLERKNRELEERINEKIEKSKRSYIGKDNEEYAIGQKRNHLEIIGYAKKYNITYLVCECDCGNVKVEQPYMWKTGIVKSCGCMHDDLAKAAHPCDTKRQDWLYTVWHRNYRKPEWHDEWREYDAFYEWSYLNGYRFGLHLHRKDTDKPFSPENCEWKEKQQYVRTKKNIKRYPVNGEMLSVQEACEKYNIIPETVRYRMKRGMTLEDAINTPLCANGRSRKTNLDICDYKAKEESA